MSMTGLCRRVQLALVWLFSTTASALAPTLRLVRDSEFILRQTTTGSSSSESNSFQDGLAIGVIGCGVIASAIVTGIATPTSGVTSITVSRRSHAKSAALQAKFPNLVSVSDSNQAVLDKAEIIFLTVLPEHTESVMKAICFDPVKHTLVSLVSTASLQDLQTYSQLPGSGIYKIICLPAVAYNEGICLLQSFTPTVADERQQYQFKRLHNLLETLGGVVMADDDHHMSAMMVPSGLMGSFYGILRNNRDWLVRSTGMHPDRATYVVTRYYNSMLQDCVRQCAVEDEASAALDRLIEDQTPGGLNEQGLKNLQILGVMKSYDQIQDAIFSRITGASDGTL